MGGIISKFELYDFLDVLYFELLYLGMEEIIITSDDLDKIPKDKLYLKICFDGLNCKRPSYIILSDWKKFVQTNANYKYYTDKYTKTFYIDKSIDSKKLCLLCIKNFEMIIKINESDKSYKHCTNIWIEYEPSLNWFEIYYTHSFNYPNYYYTTRIDEQQVEEFENCINSPITTIQKKCFAYPGFLKFN